MFNFFKENRLNLNIILLILLCFSISANIYWFYNSTLKQKLESSSLVQNEKSTRDPSLLVWEFSDSENLATEMTDLEVEVNPEDLYITSQQVGVVNQSTTTNNNTKTKRVTVKFGKKFLFRQYDVMIYFNSSNSWLRSQLVTEKQLTPEEVLLKDWRVGKIVYFTKTNQFIYLMPSQSYSIEIVDLATMEKEASFQSQIDYPEYGTIEHISCNPVSVGIAQWKAVECQYQYALQSSPADKRDNGKIVSCYLPIRGTEKDWLKFSVGIRSAGTTLNMCDLVLQDQLVLVQKL